MEAEGVSYTMSDPIVKEAETVIHRIASFKCAEVNTPCSLVIRPGAAIASYRKTVEALSFYAERSRKLDTMLRFMVGDALNHGEEVYGESYACVYGAELRGWDISTVHNVRSIARRVLPENRVIGLSFRMHADLASLTGDEQRQYLARAQKMQDSGETAFRRIVLRQLNEDKGNAIIAGLPDHKQDYWGEVFSRGDIHYTKLQAMIDGQLPVPATPKSPAEYLKAAVRDARQEFEGRQEIGAEDVVDVLSRALWKTMQACAAKEIRWKKDETWARPVEG
uniref:Uncharacterized protein n=1 Tax=viral metagenome TaxID=1070528 RepID=A0A6M3IH45_9ZZZZ